MICSLQDWKDFKSSRIWKDIQEEFNIWLDDIHTALEDNDGETLDKTLHRLGGNAETLRRVLDFPEIIIDSIEVQLEEDENGAGKRRS